MKVAERHAARGAIAAWLAVSLSACQPSPEPNGADLYANACAPCHGASGEGDGPLREALRVDVPSLRTLSISNADRFPEARVRAVLEGNSIPPAHGDVELPIWGGILGWGAPADADPARAQRRVDALVEHVRALQYR